MTTMSPDGVCERLVNQVAELMRVKALLEHQLEMYEATLRRMHERRRNEEMPSGQR